MSTDIMAQPEPEGPNNEPKIGDYVLATKWSDGDPCDHFCVGFFAGKDRDRYKVVDSDGNLFRANGFRRCETITQAEGESILSLKIGDKPGPSVWWHLERIRGIEAQPEPEGPTDEELLELSQHHSVSYTMSDGAVIYPLQEGSDMRDDVLSFARAVLARWGRPAPQTMRSTASALELTASDLELTASDLELTASDLRSSNRELSLAVSRLTSRPKTKKPVPALPAGTQVIEPTEHTLLAPFAEPVPVSERLPGLGDCDAEGMCWWWCAPAERWLRCGIPQPDHASQVHTHWLPAHALPLP